MNELLLELLSEEIPARMHANALIESKKIFEELLHAYQAEFKFLDTYISPRRLTIRVRDLAPLTKTIFQEKRGPKTTAPEKALEGFLKSIGILKEDLYEKEGYWIACVKIPSQSIKEILPSLLEAFLEKMPWPKSMKWHDFIHNQTTKPWVRPIRSVLCIYQENPLNFSLPTLGIKTNDVTYGHRFLKPDAFPVKNFEDYEKKLKDSNVLISFEEKKEKIKALINAFCQERHYRWHEEKALLEEVAGLVEYPFLGIGEIPKDFLFLPKEVMATCMKVHQKYFPLFNEKGDIVPFFAVICNCKPTKKIIEGYEKVLKARLNDAAFFYKKDLNSSFYELFSNLNSIIFHHRLGTLKDKADRLKRYDHDADFQQAATFCKVDLLTGMVGEFPELQGLMGGIYAKHQGYSQTIADAIKEHYAPQGARDKVSSTLLGRKLSLWDKLDTLVGFLSIGLLPTGSKDPFALRRNALGVIRILTHEDFKKVPLEPLIQKVISEYFIKEETSALQVSVQEFILERFRTFLKSEYHIEPEIIHSILPAAIEKRPFVTSSIYSTYHLALFLKDFLITKEGRYFEGIYKRAVGLASLSELCKVDENLFELLEEKNLYDSLQTLKEDFLEAIKEDAYKKAFNYLLTMCKSLEIFLDKAVINVENKYVKKNRQALIASFLSYTHYIVSLSK